MAHIVDKECPAGVLSVVESEGDRMSRVVTLKINDQDVSGREDETILDVARDHNLLIPTLCQVNGLS